MKTFKKVLSILTITIFILQTCAFDASFAAVDTTPQAPPSKLVNEPLREDEPAIGFNEFDSYYIDLKWDPLEVPYDAVSAYMNFYIQEIAKPYRPASSLILKERNVPGTSTNLRMKDLKPGTIYYVYATAYHTHVDGNTTYNSAESPPSNTLKILTDIKLNAYSAGTNRIKIEWDDVWNSGRRIDYKLFVSENESFTNTPPIYIGQSQIEPNGPVKVNETTGKLEYTHTVNDPGRIYYIKVVPDIAEPVLKMTPESKTVAVSSYILARTTKMSTIESGTIWKLDWSPVVTGLGDTDIKVSYQIYKGNLDTNDVPQYMAGVDDTNFFVTIAKGDVSSFFIIRAIITRNGEDVYPGIKIESDRIIVKEEETISTPAVPELVEQFERVPGDPIIRYEDELKSQKATILWRAPKKANGEIDVDIRYDIWLINDPDVIDQPPDNTKIASSIKMESANLVMDGVEVKGYKYALENLMPNSTYYFKIVAKKTFIDYVDNKLEYVTRGSQPALKIIITPTEGPIDQPQVPSRPPLKIKQSPVTGGDLISKTTATIQLKNKWYEKYNPETQKWEYVRAEKTSITDVPPYNPVEQPPDDLHYRVVKYDPGVTIDVGCIEYKDGMTYNDILSIPADKITGFPVTANDPYEDRLLNPDKLKHNIDIPLTNLLPNTTYIVWIRAVRKSANLISGPSDPIIITTSPSVIVPIEKPTVPTINYSMPGDDYVDLAWNFKPGYNYYIKYGTVENIDAAQGMTTVKPEDLLYSSFYKVKGLTSETLYFFWIQAESSNEAGEKSLSEWSDSYTVKTLENIPPASPRGFGVKSEEGAVTKNSITFEWIMEEDTLYILEIASDIDYTDVQEYTVGAVSEFTVDGLRSNYRYYARLYALDPVKNIQSEPTQSVTVRTLRSNDDYDSDEDIENILDGEYIIKDPAVVDGVWNIKIIGANADRFIYHLQRDHKLDYMVDVSEPPAAASTINVLVSNKVFGALGLLKENLIISTGEQKVILEPGTLAFDRSNTPVKSTDFNYELRFTFGGDASNNPVKNMSFKTDIFSIGINAYDGSNPIPVNTLNKPLKFVVSYDEVGFYKEGVTSGFVYPPTLSTWMPVKTSASYDANNQKGHLSFETVVLGDMAVADVGNNYFDDTLGHWAEDAINDVFSAHDIKSVQGRIFRPDDACTLGDTVQLMLDVLDYNYGSNYMTVAAKSGIISFGEAYDPSVLCTREKALSMVVRVYELKSGRTATPSLNPASNYEDLHRVSATLFPRIQFAIENGFVVGKTPNTIAPKEPVTRAEVMAFLQKMMALAGEID